MSSASPNSAAIPLIGSSDDSSTDVCTASLQSSASDAASQRSHEDRPNNCRSDSSSFLSVASKPKVSISKLLAESARVRRNGYTREQEVDRVTSDPRPRSKRLNHVPNLSVFKLKKPIPAKPLPRMCAQSLPDAAGAALWHWVSNETPNTRPYFESANSTSLNDAQLSSSVLEHVDVSKLFVQKQVWAWFRDYGVWLKNDDAVPSRATTSIVTKCTSTMQWAAAFERMYYADNQRGGGGILAYRTTQSAPQTLHNPLEYVTWREQMRDPDNLCVCIIDFAKMQSDDVFYSPEVLMQLSEADFKDAYPVHESWVPIV